MALLPLTAQRFEGHFPRRSKHCHYPPCANLCPWGAAARLDNGIVRIDDALPHSLRGTLLTA